MGAALDHNKALLIVGLHADLSGGRGPGLRYPSDGSLARRLRVPELAVFLGTPSLLVLRDVRGSSASDCFSSFV